MAKQHHDIGWKKRQRTEAATPVANAGYNTDALALQLVLNGHASPQILNYSRPYEIKTRQAQP